MSDRSDYRIRLFGRDGFPMGTRLIATESVTEAVLLAAEIATASEAADFSITPLPPKVLKHLVVG